MKLIERLLEHLATVTPDEVAIAGDRLKLIRTYAGEEEAGILSEELQKLWALICRLTEQRNAEVAKVQRLTFDDLNQMMPEEMHELASRTNKIAGQLQAATSFFWSAVQAEFDLFGTEGLVLRANWKLATTDPICPNCLCRHPQEDSNPVHSFEFSIITLPPRRH
ncbi:MAG: hypothetical protein WAV15_04490 [Minisyncoccia bacterium]